MGNDQKPRCSSYIATEPHGFKLLQFLQCGYHTPQLKNIAIPAIAFSLHNVKLLPIHYLEFLGLAIPLNFFWREVETMCQFTIVSNITMLVSHSVICFGYFMPISHCVKKKAPPSNS